MVVVGAGSTADASLFVRDDPAETVFNSMTRILPRLLLTRKKMAKKAKLAMTTTGKKMAAKRAPPGSPP